MRKKLSVFVAFFALCWAFNVSAQKLLFDATGTGSTFTKVGGSQNYTLNLNGNKVTNGKVTIGTTGGIAISVSPAVPNNTGITVMIDAENIPTTDAPLVELVQQGVAGAFGIWRLENGNPQGYWDGKTFNSDDFTVGKITEAGVFSMAYYGANETGKKGTKAYFKGAQIYYKSGLVFTGSGQTLTNVLIGKKTGKAPTPTSTGLVIKRIQIYEGQLTTEQIIAAEKSIQTPISDDPLVLAITAAKLVHTNAVESPNPGRFSKENKDIFNAAIKVAETISGTNPDKATASAAIETLNTAKETFLKSRNQIKLSTAENTTWYYLTGVINYASGKAIVASGATEGADYNFTDKTLNASKLFKFEDAGNGKVSIKNWNTQMYISGNGKATATPAAFTATFLGEDGQYTFNLQGSNPLHAQQNGSLLVTWAGGLNTGSAWRLEELPTEDIKKPISIADIDLTPGFLVTGIGNENHPLMYANVNVDGLVGTVKAKGMKFDLSKSSSISSIKKLKVYAIPLGDKRLIVANAKLIGEANVTGNEVQVNLTDEQPLKVGINRFCLAVDIADNAVEGNTIQAKFVDITLADDTKKVVNLSTPNPCVIFLTQSLVIAPGDYGSVSYRIPAIVTANDGTLVVVTDKRKNGSGDLPGDIDLIVQRSTDNGKTWSQPNVIAGQNTNSGYGDPLIGKDKETGKLIILCVNDQGFFGSTPEKPIRLIYFESIDNGATWTAPRDITKQIWGAECTNTITKAWKGMFPASGHITQLRSGRLMCAMLVRNPVTGSNDNFVMYTDDKGATWHPSTEMVVKGGDEAKLVQRNDGKVIISSRQGGGRVWNISNDEGGIKWTQTKQYKRPELLDQNCNGEILNYTSTLDNFNKNRMLHSLCFNSGARKNVSMLISYDEGKTWPYRKSICPESSAYSTFTILPDGTIGMYYEDGTHGGTAYEMVFVRFSVNWLTDGTDTFEVPTSIDKNQSSNIQIAVENNKIVVRGTEVKPQIFSISGVEMKGNTTLAKGVYLVKIGSKTTTVIVK
ncbi:MAG: sialidase family protein [Bacteroidaceae bacterium]